MDYSALAIPSPVMMRVLVTLSVPTGLGSAPATGDCEFIVLNEDEVQLTELPT